MSYNNARRARTPTGIVRHYAITSVAFGTTSSTRWEHSPSPVKRKAAQASLPLETNRPAVDDETNPRAATDLVGLPEKPVLVHATSLDSLDSMMDSLYSEHTIRVLHPSKLVVVTGPLYNSVLVTMCYLFSAASSWFNKLCKCLHVIWSFVCWGFPLFVLGLVMFTLASMSFWIKMSPSLHSTSVLCSGPDGSMLLDLELLPLSNATLSAELWTRGTRPLGFGNNATTLSCVPVNSLGDDFLPIDLDLVEADLGHSDEDHVSEKDLAPERDGAYGFLSLLPWTAWAAPQHLNHIISFADGLIRTAYYTLLRSARKLSYQVANRFQMHLRSV
ncbi:hypothetical protein HYDPIDRAFT_165666 [Hydnomerulius pinastri MD-312]|nr:hypothetical protein HYDPIDRAFT_165666 [Hydnomerulius pinastri MD-312]